MNLKFIANPYISFSIIWTIGVLAYLLEWSDAFPTPSSGLFIFLSIAVILSILIGNILYSKKYFQFKPIARVLNFKFLLSLNVGLWILNFGYSRIPIIEILRGVEFSYTDFGIPILIVFITCFNSFLCIYSFHCYLSTKKKKYIYYGLVCLGLFVLAYSRGSIMINLISCTFLALSAKGSSVSFKQLALFVIGGLIIMFGFGYAGNLRTAQAVARDNRQSSYSYDNEIILKIASASPAFTNNIIPNEFYWTYLYIASPLSNLQYNVNRPHFEPYEFKDFMSIIVNETWYETVSKRLGEQFPSIKRKDPELVINNLNVATTFTRSFNSLGYLGLFVMLLHILFMPIVYIKIIGLRSQYLPVAIAIMCSIYFFSIFDNMFSFVGTGPQLLFPLFFEFLDRIKTKRAYGI